MTAIPEKEARAIMHRICEGVVETTEAAIRKVGFEHILRDKYLIPGTTFAIGVELAILHPEYAHALVESLIDKKGQRELIDLIVKEHPIGGDPG